MTLDPVALEKAAQAYEASPCMDLIGPMEAAITTYLSSLTPKGELAERLLKVSQAIFLATGEDVARDVSNLLREAAAALSLPADQGWRSIEFAPKDQDILVFIPDAAQGMSVEIAHCASDDADSDWYPGTHDGGPIDITPTHWQPIPAPPTDETPHG